MRLSAILEKIKILNVLPAIFKKIKFCKNFECSMYDAKYNSSN